MSKIMPYFVIENINIALPGHQAGTNELDRFWMWSGQGQPVLREDSGPHTIEKEFKYKYCSARQKKIVVLI